MGLYMYTFYANDVAQLLYYNIQRLNPYDNNKCNNMNQYNDDVVNYVVNDIV